MYDFGFWRKFVQIPGNPVVKARPDGKEHVAFADCDIGGIPAVHTTVADIIRMPGRQRAFSHHGCDNRNPHGFRQPAQFFLRVAQKHAAAC